LFIRTGNTTWGYGYFINPEYTMKTSRRNFITRSMLATAGISAGLSTIAKAGGSEAFTDSLSATSYIKGRDALKISVFSKHLQWLNYNDMAEVACEIGFDGIDLTVRPGGHVLPERVEEDLPKAMEAVKKAGLDIYMITTSVNNADDPLSEKILKTASSLGIPHYRMGYMHYDDARTVEENLSLIYPALSKLAALNEKYSISGEYQNHSGNYGSGIYFGGPIWDLAGALKSVNSQWLGSQYDIYHATVEGANAWPVGLKLISPYIWSADIKDFTWEKRNGKWASVPVPLGEGVVDYKKYTELLKQIGFGGPLSIHYEYQLGGAEHGNKEITIAREAVVSAMKKDLLTLKSYLQVAGLV
jgi:sugar phosphate isomerase/epimerase